MKNEILAEVWHNRDEFAKRCNYDLDRMVEELRKTARDPGNPLVRLKRRVSRRKPQSRRITKQA